MLHKKNILFVIASLMMLSITASAFNSDSTKSTSPEKIPAELVGKWLNGTFSMSNWWSYDGKKYLGNPYTRSVAFNFSANGETEFFLAIKTNTGYCSTEGFTYHKGIVKFNEADHSFTVYPEKGSYRGFYSCAPGGNFDRPAKKEELKPTTYYWSFEKVDNQEYLVIRFSADKSSAGSYFKPATW